MLLLIGCNSSNQLSQAQLNAIETREVDASMGETYNAASGALFDAGYTIAMSDRQGGLLTGTKAHDRSDERFWVSPYIEDTKFALSIQIRETSPKACTVRIKTSINGAPKVDKKAIDELWVLMQRQVLMKEPLPLLDEKTIKDKLKSRSTQNQDIGTQLTTPEAVRSEKSLTKNPEEMPAPEREVVTEESSEEKKLDFVVGATQCSICGRDIKKYEQFCLYKMKRVCPECYEKLK
jgi:hypothetical protein